MTRRSSLLPVMSCDPQSSVPVSVCVHVGFNVEQIPRLCPGSRGNHLFVTQPPPPNMKT